jgi:hypothetical protein
VYSSRRVFVNKATGIGTMSGDKRKDNRGRADKGEAVVSAIARTIDMPGGDGLALEGRTERNGDGPSRSTWQTGLHAEPSERPEAVRKEAASAPSVDLWQEPMPVWLSALLAVKCSAVGNGGDHGVLWNCISGRAVYTNLTAHSQRIEPLGVTLMEGQSLAVCWLPGETTYSLKVFRRFDQCA